LFDQFLKAVAVCDGFFCSFAAVKSKDIRGMKKLFLSLLLINPLAELI